MSKDYYKTLGVDKNASQDDIKKAFRKLAHEHHPDKKTGNAEKFKEANEAYSVLSDENKRKQYDTFGSAGPGQQSGFNGQDFGGFDFSGFSQGFGNQGGVEFDLGDIFGNIFGGGQQSRSRVRKGRDIQVDVELTFKEAIFGVDKNINIEKISTCDECSGTGGKKGTEMKQCADCGGSGKITESRRSMLGSFETTRTCDTCNGAGKIPKEKCSACAGKGVRRRSISLTVSIPSGIEDQQAVRLSSGGEAVAGGVAGDLFVKVHVAEHKVWNRDGNNLVTELPVKLTDALLGAEYQLETLDGTITLKIPEGAGDGEILRIKGKGVPTGQNRRGDALVVLKIVIPKKLSKSARTSIEALKKEGI
jgi:molecular chaperone DnaJ